MIDLLTAVRHGLCQGPSPLILKPLQSLPARGGLEGLKIGEREGPLGQAGGAGRHQPTSGVARRPIPVQPRKREGHLCVGGGGCRLSSRSFAFLATTTILNLSLLNSS